MAKSKNHLRFRVNCIVDEHVFESVHGRDPKAVATVLYACADQLAVGQVTPDDVLTVDGEDINFAQAKKNMMDRAVDRWGLIFGGFISGFVLCAVLGSMYYG